MSLWQTTRDTGVTFTEVEADVFPVRSTSARGSPRSSERAKQFTQFTQRVQLTERFGGGSFGVGVEVDFVQGGAERGGGAFFPLERVGFSLAPGNEPGRFCKVVKVECTCMPS